MISLFIDTASSKLIVALYKNNEQLFFESVNTNNDLSRKVLNHVDNALNKVNLKIKDVDKIYVVDGPGSFTGIRVGITIAKTIAYALNKPIYTISELTLLATTKTDKKIIVPLIDARRGYVYGACYDNKLNSIINDKYISYEELISTLKEKHSLEDICFVSYNDFDNSIIPEVDVEKILNLDLKEKNPHVVNPNYLKSTEAEEKLNAKTN